MVIKVYFIRTIYLVSIISLVACAPNSVKVLKETVRPTVFYTDKPFEEVYEDLVFKQKGCWVQSFGAMIMYVQNRLNRNNGYGEIVLRSTNMGDVSIWVYTLVEQLKSESKIKTKVTVYVTRTGSWGEQGELIKNWVLNDTDNCY